MKRIKRTCTFPKYSYRILRPNELIEPGDLYNWNNPDSTFEDEWYELTDTRRKKNQLFEHQDWVVIRPL